MKFSIEELALATGAVILLNTVDKNVKFEISTDSRTISPKDIYLPLIGESFDGRIFIKDVVESGVKAYFTTNDIIYEDAKLVLKVENTLDAYLSIASYYRKKINPFVIAITGSSGKTTTKEMLYSVVSEKFKAHKTFSNHNNEIGFCQTVLSMDDDVEVLIVEMGMRGLGEIELISKNLYPDLAIITNCGSSHVGRLGSLENIAKAKCEIVKGLDKNGLFIGLNQKRLKNALIFDGQKIFYSLKDVEILKNEIGYSEFTYKGDVYRLNVEGEYNIENSLAVIEVGKKLGMTSNEIATGLFNYKPIEKRWEISKINNISFINDSYNANPESMKASVKTFIQMYSNPVVVLGDMGELGEKERFYHKELGKYLSSLSKNVIYIMVGDLSHEIGKELENNGFKVVYFTDNKSVASFILEKCDESNTVFLKASRFMKFEEILDYIEKGTCKL